MKTKRIIADMLRRFYRHIRSVSILADIFPSEVQNGPRHSLDGSSINGSRGNLNHRHHRVVTLEPTSQGLQIRKIGQK